MTKFCPPTTLFGENRMLSGPEIEDMMAGNEIYCKDYAYIGMFDPKEPQGINQRLLDLNFEWYKNKRPAIFATDSTIWKVVETGLAALDQNSKLTNLYHLTQLPVTMILFPHFSTLDYLLPQSVLANRKNGQYCYFKTLRLPEELPPYCHAGCFNLEWLPEKSILEDDLEQSCTFFTEVFLLGLSFVLVEEKIPNLRDLVYNSSINQYNRLKRYRGEK